MKLGIMQPYLFPYIGYFQLVALVDLFVVHDNVQYIKGGWINRNRILVNGRPRYFTLPVQADSSTLPINERRFVPDWERSKRRILAQVEGAYRQAPFFEEVFSLIERCFGCDDPSLPVFITTSLRECCTFLGVTTPIVPASGLAMDTALKGQDRVLDICRVTGAGEYINPIGGMHLYQREAFARQGVQLHFLRPRELTYCQLGGDYVPDLSIIDVLMFNGPEKTRALLDHYVLE